MSTAPPLRRSLRPQAMRLVDIPLRRLLGLPFPTPLARPEIVGDDEVEALLDRMAHANRSTLRFVGVKRGADGRLERAPIEHAVRHGFRIVGWRLDAPGAVRRGDEVGA